MAGTTQVPAISWGTAGPVAPSGPAILAGRQADYDVAFNVTFNWTGVTPQGQLASSESTIIANVYNLIVYYVSQTDPNYAQGRMQDALGQIYFLNRNPAIATQLLINCLGGGAGVAVQLNGLDLYTSGIATIQDNAGNLYQLLTTINLPSGGGTVQGSFACSVPGPTPVPSGTTPVSIYKQVNGWDGVSLVSGVQGIDTESRAAFEARRQDSVAGNSMGAAGAVIGAVAKVPGVIDYFGFNNNSASPFTIGGVTVAANAMYVCVAGGSPSAIAQAILSKIGPGAPMTGTTTETAYDNNPLYATPIPYQISFQIPTPLQLLFSVTLVSGANIPSNAITLIQNAILAAVTQGVISPAAVFTGSISGGVLTVTAVTFGTIAVGQNLQDTTGALSGGTQITGFLTGSGGIGTYSISVAQTVPSETMSALTASSQVIPNLRARIGQTVYASTYTQVINALGSWAQVAAISIGSANTPGAVIVGFISGTTMTVLSAITGTIVAGQTLSDAVGVIIVGTTVTSQISGTPGGAGTYTVSNLQTVAGATFTGNGSGTTLTASAVTGIIKAGQVIAGIGVPSNTTIIEQLTGTPGGAGTYQTSVVTTASSASITTYENLSLSTANQTLVSIQASQIPQLIAGDVAVGVT
jgi:hypothetical protein